MPYQDRTESLDNEQAPYGYPNRYAKAGPSNYMSHPLDDRYASSTGNLNAQQRAYHDLSYDSEAFDLDAIDPALRLRTTRTAHSVIAESIRSEDARINRKRSRLLQHLKRRGTEKLGFRSKSSRASNHNRDLDKEGELDLPAIADSEAGTSQAGGSQAGDDAPPDPQPLDTPTQGKDKKPPMPRRSVFVNMPLPQHDLDQHGEPRVRYARNKVRTSKYTLLTFLPRNLFEQFHRVANIYFLGLVILQLFPIFGATTPEIAMLPLVAILGMTAIKDAVEDWRRSKLDEEVNTSAATKLGNWRNVNQPTDPRNWFERVLHIGPSELINTSETDARPSEALQGSTQAACSRSARGQADYYGALLQGGRHRGDPDGRHP